MNSTAAASATDLSAFLLDPKVQYLIGCFHYVVVGCVGAALWDYIILFPTEIKYIWRRKFNIISFAYVICRHQGWIAIPIALVANFGRPDNCNAMVQIIYSMHTIAQSATAFIFYQRTLALFEQSRTIFWTFGLGWLAVTVNWIAIVPFFHSTRLPDVLLQDPYTPACYSLAHPAWTSSAVITSFCFDIAVFVVTIIKAHRTGQLGMWRQMSQLSKVFFETGIFYFLVACLFNAIAIGFIYQDLDPFISDMIAPLSGLFEIVVPARIVLELKKQDGKYTPGNTFRSSDSNGFGTSYSTARASAKEAFVDVIPAATVTRDRSRDLEQGRNGGIMVQREAHAF